MFSWNNAKFVINKIFNLRILAGGFVCCVWETSFILQTTNENILLTPPPSAHSKQAATSCLFFCNINFCVLVTIKLNVSLVCFFIWYMVFYPSPWEALPGDVWTRLRREGWGIGQSIRPSSMWPWFRSWYVNHTCVRFSFLIFLPQRKYCYAEVSLIWNQLSDVEQIAALLCQIFYVFMECFLQTRGHPRL